MLIEFSVANYLSFREKATLSMVASNDGALPGNIIPKPEGFGHPLLRSAAIYGANGSGKSNLLKAMRFSRDLILNSSRESTAGDPIARVPFKFDPECRDKASEFEWVFLHKGVQYVYAFAVDERRVVSESLTHYPKGKPAKVFERRLKDSARGEEAGNGENTENIEGDVQYEYFIPKPFHAELKDLKDKTRDNALFLSVAAQFNVLSTLVAVHWFLSMAIESPMIEDNLSARMIANREPGMADYVARFMRFADLGVERVEAEGRSFADSLEFKRMAREARTEVLSLIGRDEAVSREFTSTVARYDVLVFHSVGGGSDKARAVPLYLQDESDGTQKVFRLAALWRAALEQGRVMFIDELEASLHPAICRALIQAFHGEANTACGQLIFTTHNSDLLDLDLFRRDQIWMSELNPGRATELYSLYDFDPPPRKDENLRRTYLKGKYGGVPVVGDLGRE